MDTLFEVAVKRRALAQKNVITFSDAPDARHEFLVPLEKAGLREVQVALRERGIVYHTLVSEPGGTRVVIIDQDRKQGSQITAAANCFGAEDVDNSRAHPKTRNGGFGGCRQDWPVASGCEVEHIDVA